MFNLYESIALYQTERGRNWMQAFFKDYSVPLMAERFGPETLLQAFERNTTGKARTRATKFIRQALRNYAF